MTELAISLIDLERNGSLILKAQWHHTAHEAFQETGSPGIVIIHQNFLGQKLCAAQLILALVAVEAISFCEYVHFFFACRFPISYELNSFVQSFIVVH